MNSNPKTVVQMLQTLIHEYHKIKENAILLASPIDLLIGS